MKTKSVILTNLCRMLLALTMIVSGFVKAVDPLGTQYKITDYLAALGVSTSGLELGILSVAVLLCMVEFALGVMLFFGIYRKFSSKATLVLMVFMTIVSLWLFLFNPISDCGCFGDAFYLSNAQTFIKNLVLLTASIVVVRRPVEIIRFVSAETSWLVLHYTLLFVLGISLYCLYILPIFDFRPYKIGTDVRAAMEIPEDAEQPEFETTFIMQKDGVTQEFALEDYPDSTWEFIDTKTVVVKEGYVPPIHDFSIQTLDGEEITDDIVGYEGYTFLLVSPHLENANDANFGPIDQIYEYAHLQGYRFYCLTASGSKAISQWEDYTGAEYPFLNVDDIVLKTIVRSNPGLLLMKDGVILNKWSHNNLPDDELTDSLDKIEIGKVKEKKNLLLILNIVLLFFVPLLIISIADRTWAFTKWLRRKRIMVLPDEENHEAEAESKE